MATPHTDATSTDPSNDSLLSGSCICGTIRYTLSPPMITHCCHCNFCQNSTGSAFALNLVVETYNFNLLAAHPLYASRPSPSAPDGSAHTVAYCPNRDCNTDLFAFYGGNKATVYVKAGTLDQGSRKRVRPDVHIFAKEKVGWVDLRGEEERGVKVFEGFYEAGDVWGEEALGRLEKLRRWRVEQEGGGGRKEGTSEKGDE